jgi:hypothetical protein
LSLTTQSKKTRFEILVFKWRDTTYRYLRSFCVCYLKKNHRSFLVPFMSRFDHLSTYFCLFIRFDFVSIKRRGNMFLITLTWSNIVNSMSEGLSYCCLTLTLYFFSYSLKFIYTNTEHTEGTKTLVWQAFVRLMFQLSFHYLAIECTWIDNYTLFQE